MAQSPKRMFDRRTFLQYSGGAGAAAFLAACGGESPNAPGAEGEGAAVGEGGTYEGPSVTLAFWNGFTGADGPVMGQLIKQFNSEHDNIKVEQNTQEWADFYESVPSAVQSGKGPDLGIMHIDQLATNAARNVIIPLDELANQMAMKAENFPEPVWTAGIYKDARYGIPLDIHPLGFYYNKDLMEKAGLDPESPPQDHDSYMAALDKFKGKKIQGHWMSPFPFTGGLSFQALLWQFGGEMFNEDGTQAKFHEEPGVEALTWMANLVKDGHSPSNVDQDADHIAFTNGKNAFHWNGIWQALAYEDTKGLNWGVAPLPQIGGVEKAAWAGSHNFVIMKARKPDPNKQQAAGVFIKWIGEHSLEWAKGGQIPANAQVREDPGFEDLDFQNTLAAQLDYVQFPPAVPGIGDAINVMMEEGVQEGVLGRKSPEQALSDAGKSAQQLLDENAKKFGA